MMIKKKIKVGVLGATGSVGQKFIQLLSNHPFFELTEVAASEKSAGKQYQDAVNWMLAGGIPNGIKNKNIKTCEPNLDCRIVFSGLDSNVAGEIEENFAREGYIVVSNSKNHRFDEDVPLLVPEVNPEHLELVRSQKFGKGMIITNPNCSTIGLVIALKPIYDAFGIESVNVTTMQALSGAGYPGVPSLDIIDNVIPFIGGEEGKMETEPLKIFGKLSNKKIINEKFKISASCNRVAVMDGHLESVQVKLKMKASEKDIIDTWKKFRAKPQEFNLPFAPLNPVHYFDIEKYPQPRIHRDIDKGMATSIGRLRKCKIFDFKFTILSHNTVRGAAGGSILCAELLLAEGYVK